MKIENNEINFSSLLKLCWEKKLTIFIVTAFTILIVNAGVYFGIEKKYKAQVLLSEREEQSSTELPSGLGSLGALVGIGGKDSGEADKTLKIMQTRSFIERFVTKYNYLPILFAVKSWDKESNSLLYADYYNPNDGWGIPKPSIFEVQKRFLSSIDIAQDNVTEFISISFTHNSPYIAKEVLDNLVNGLNILMQEQAINNAELSVKYLKEELEKTELLEFRKTLLKLIESELQKKMIANVHSDYVFITIDPAVVNFKPVSPQTLLFAMLSVIFGFSFGVLIVLIETKFKSSEHKCDGEITL
ncbi:hypothetical protein [Pseudoalteromonas fuliginea]|uniref:Polysaccharide chain length determinant N-terminal domain-containing protein n=1 Tax=Pseudoalteromonas fuliginea TaxID=1872678 RepID=A0ABQ6RMQ4_9GAMM|nr:hypothetical protein [Pseudoalteromonas fuliginea]KAA1164524.1 hypothetical protein EU509_02130 [Pseudoalteromonas fuliginea]KAA1169117.1 hypothetical protein EUZ79_02425 [Pseudoalteromonas fuliginea]